MILYIYIFRIIRIWPFFNFNRKYIGYGVIFNFKNIPNIFYIDKQQNKSAHLLNDILILDIYLY